MIKTPPVETVTKIKPSEAIRLGCLIAPFEEGYVDHEYPRHACVYGAMALGFIGAHDMRAVSALARAFHSEMRFERPCPESSCDLARADPAHLNDDHRWPRERIADWLDELGL